MGAALGAVLVRQLPVTVPLAQLLTTVVVLGIACSARCLREPVST